MITISKIFSYDYEGRYTNAPSDSGPFIAHPRVEKKLVNQSRAKEWNRHAARSIGSIHIPATFPGQGTGDQKQNKDKGFHKKEYK